MLKQNYIQTSVDNENEKFFSFKTECDCYAHDLSIILEKEKDVNCISLVFYDKVYIGEDYDCGNWFKKLIFRIKCAFSCLFNDGFEIEHGFIFKGKDHLIQFQKYLNERIDLILKDKDCK